MKQAAGEASGGEERTRAAKRELPLPAYCIAIVLITAISFLPTLRSDFVNLDDGTYVSADPDIRGFTSGHLAKIFSSTYVNHYLPVTMLSYMVDYSIGGLNPFVFHLTSLLLHCANCLLVFLLISRLSRSRLRGCIGALLFAVSPLRVESVAWIAERKDVLSALFFFASLLCYVSYRDKGRRWPYVASLLLFAVALLSKTMAVSLPLVMLLSDYLQDKKITPRRLIEKIPFFCLSAAFSLIAFLSAQKAIISYPDYSALQKLLLPVKALVFYLGRSLLPFNLCAYYYFPSRPEHGLNATLALTALVAVAMVAAVVYSARRTKVVVFGALFYVVTLLPVLQVLNSGGMVYVAERYAYIPMVGICFAAAVGIARLMESKSRALRPAAALAITAIIIVFAVQTWRRCGVWNNSFTLWNDTIARQPSWYAFYSRGRAFRSAGDLDRAIDDCRTATTMEDCGPEDYNLLGTLCGMEGRTFEAIAALTTSLRLDSTQSMAWFNRGLAYLNGNDPDRAIGDFTKAIVHAPELAKAYNNRGVAWAMEGRHDRALADFNRCLELSPGEPGAEENRDREIGLVGKADK
jgi:tetratricopeptide (TPR) repeat protein